MEQAFEWLSKIDYGLLSLVLILEIIVLGIVFYIYQLNQRIGLVMRSYNRLDSKFQKLLNSYDYCKKEIATSRRLHSDQWVEFGKLTTECSSDIRKLDEKLTNNLMGIDSRFTDIEQVVPKNKDNKKVNVNSDPEPPPKAAKKKKVVKKKATKKKVTKKKKKVTKKATKRK